VLRPATCEEVMAVNCALVREPKELALIEPIWVLVREPNTLVDRAATSALFRPEIVVVESDEAWVVVRPANWPVARPPMTEESCVLDSEPTCVLLNEVAVSAPNWVVESCETLPVEIAAVWAVPSEANWLVLRPATWEEVTAVNCALVREPKELALIEPICVLVSEATTLVDNAATSALFRPEIVVVESDEAWVVVMALNWLAPRLPMTEVTWVLVSALT